MGQDFDNLYNMYLDLAGLAVLGRLGDYRFPGTIATNNLASNQEPRHRREQLQEHDDQPEINLFRQRRDS